MLRSPSNSQKLSVIHLFVLHCFEIINVADGWLYQMHGFLLVLDLEIMEASSSWCIYCCEMHCKDGAVG